MTALYPLLLEPKVKEVVWGGRWLADELHRVGPPDAPLGESWEAYSGSVVVNGPLAGQTLGDLFVREGASLFGTASVRYPQFPLLVKFIDARENLSIQVHPDDEWAQALENYPFGKTEFWYVLEAKPDAAIIYGLHEDPCTPDDLRAAMERGEMLPHCAQVPVRPGDVISIPAGTVHALTAGVVVYELQQDCDITYRLYDWGRTGREIHLDKGLRVTDFAQRALRPAHPELVASDGYAHTLLDKSPFYTSELARIENGSVTPASFAGQGSSFVLLTAIDGAGALLADGQPFDTLPLAKGTTALIPAGLSYRLQAAALDAPLTVIQSRLV